jgi:hypothetical protein
LGEKRKKSKKEKLWNFVKKKRKKVKRIVTTFRLFVFGQRGRGSAAPTVPTFEGSPVPQLGRSLLSRLE